jgi:peptide-methionine (S)-S-oxide reductase
MRLLKLHMISPLWLGRQPLMRHLNAPSLRQFTNSSSSPEMNRACFGAGCFWGTEKFFKNDFVKRHPDVGLRNGRVGFMGPSHAKENPIYRDVCSGQTGHVEVYDFSYEGDIDTFELLCQHFFSFHDPTTVNRQGNDVGTHYASVIYCYTEDQMKVAQKVKQDFQHLLDKKVARYSGSTIITEIRKATSFYPADEGHQAYLDNNPGGYCNHFYRVDAENFPALLPKNK